MIMRNIQKKDGTQIWRNESEIETNLNGVKFVDSILGKNVKTWKVLMMEGGMAQTNDKINKKSESMLFFY